MINAMNDDVRTLEERLAEACRTAGLNAEVSGGVKVSAPGAHPRLAETVTCALNGRGNPIWVWSWGDPICPAADIADAVEAIAHVVTPTLR